MPYVESTIVIDAPAQRVYELAKDQEHFPQFMPDVETVTILQRRPDGVISRWKTLVEEAPIEWTEDDRFDDAALRIDYKLIEGDLDKFEGAWTFENRDGRTHVVLGVDFDFGVPTLAELIGPTLERKVRENSEMMLAALKTPSGGERVNKFCFVIHPLSLQDIERYEPGAKGKGEPILRKIMEWMPPYAAVHVTGVRTPDGRETEGWFVAATFLPQSMLDLPREDVYGKVLGAIEIGARLGAQIAGLGAFTGVVGDGGDDDQRTFADSGNDRQLVDDRRGRAEPLSRRAGDGRRHRDVHGRGHRRDRIDRRRVRASDRAAKLRRLILVARNERGCASFTRRSPPTLPCESEYTTDVSSAVRRSQLVLTATCSTQDVIEPEDLRAGAIVCELSLPHDVSRRVARERPDVLVVEGGNMRVPGNPRFERVREPGTDFDLNLPARTALACMSETMILALEGRFEPYTIGRGIKLEKVIEIEEMAQRVRIRARRHARVRRRDHAREHRRHPCGGRAAQRPHRKVGER